MDPSTLVIAIVYAVAIGAPSHVMPGVRLGPGVDVASHVRGLLIPERGVVQLDADSALTTGDRPGSLRLRRGRARVVADAPLSITVSGLEVEVGTGGEALVTHRGADGVVVCAVRGEVLVNLPELASRVADRSDAAQSDSGVRRIEAGQCWIEAYDRSTALESHMIESVRHSVSVAPPPPVDLPDLVGDVSEQLEEVEAEWGDALAQGPRREAQSCGCSENGSTSGSLDPTAPVTPDPDPEHGDPGRVRILVRLPTAN